MSLFVGASKRLINPTEDMFPYPSYQPGNPYVGVYTNCFVRAIVMDNGKDTALYVGFDLGGVPDTKALKGRIEKECGIPAHHILFSAIHNHTGCDIVFSPDPADRAKWRAYMDMVNDQAVEAVKEAIRKKQPAKYGFGIGRSFVNGNRDMACEDGTFTQGYEPEGYCDRNVYVMKFADLNGKLISAIVSYGMHATLGYFDVDADGKTRCSGNIPGVAEEYAENRFGDGAVVLWASESAGDQNPQLYCLRDYDQDGFPYMSKLLPGLQYNLIKVMGQRHGVDICKAINAIDHYNKNMPMKFGQTYIDLPAQKFEEEFNGQWVNDITNHIYPMKPGEKLPTAVPDPDEKVPLYIQIMALGDVAIVGVAAELYALIGKYCHEVSPYAKTMVVTHVERSVGYIIDKTSVDHYCFEQFGKIQAGACDEIIPEGVRQLFDDMNEV